MKKLKFDLIYVLINQKNSVFRNINTEKSYSISSEGVFDHPRVLIHDPEIASKFIAKNVKKVKERFRRPIILIHWLGELEGGITKTEEILLFEATTKRLRYMKYEFICSTTELSMNEIEKHSSIF